jgi:Sensors of blue-light using FAD
MDLNRGRLPPVYTLVYVSTDAIRFSDADLNGLLEQSRRDNVISGITGLLLYKDGNFMQILEGSKEAVLTLMAKVKKDARHRNIMVLLEQEIAQREFKDWAMAFRKLRGDTVLEIPGYSDFLDLPLTSDHFSNPSKVLQFLITFKKSVS